MARGAQKTAENTAQQIGTSAATQQTAANQTATNALGAEMPTIMSYLAPGGNPAVTAAAMGALGSKMGAQQAQASDRAARTGNTASAPAIQQALARTQGQEAAQAAAGNIAGQQGTAIKALQDIYGLNENQINQMLSQRTGANNSYVDAAKIPGFGSSFSNAFGGALGKTLGSFGYSSGPFSMGTSS